MGGGRLLLNNKLPSPALHSEVWELKWQADAAGNDSLAPCVTYGPLAPVWSYTEPIPTDLFSELLSSAQGMRNGNTLISSGASASLTIPPGAVAALIGVEFHHPFVAVDPSTPKVTLASNAQRLTLGPVVRNQNAIPI